MTSLSYHMSYWCHIYSLVITIIPYCNLCNLINKMQTNIPVNVMLRMWLTSCKSRTIIRPQTKHTASHTDWLWLHLRDAWCSYHAGVTNMFMQWRKWSKTDSFITVALFIHCFTMECPGICLGQIQTQILQGLRLAQAAVTERWP